MFLIVTRSFPPDVGGMQVLMGGLSENLLNHSINTMNEWLKLPFNKQIESKVSLRNDIINVMVNTIEKENDNFINAWFSEECRTTMESIIKKLGKK